MVHRGLPASTLRRTVSIWASPSAPALSLRLIVPTLLCHVFYLPRLPVVALSTSLSRLCHSFALTPFPLPFFPSPSFHRIFVASFSPHHSLAVILHHLPVVLTSHSIALRPDTGRIHGTPRRCHHTIRLLSTTPAADIASGLYNLATIMTDMYTSMYTYVRNSFVPVSFGPYELRDRQRVGGSCTAEY